MKSLALDVSAQVGFGAFGDVFRVSDHVVKLFKAHDRSRRRLIGDLSPEQEDAKRRLVFGAERDALLIASRDPSLAAHTPAFFGPVAVSDVTWQGESVRHRYLLDCALEMRYVEAAVQDLLPGRTPSYIADFIRRMNDAGIGRTDDMILWQRDNPHSFVVGDFATYDAVLYVEHVAQGIPASPPPAPPAPHGTDPRDRT